MMASRGFGSKSTTTNNSSGVPHATQRDETKLTVVSGLDEGKRQRRTTQHIATNARKRAVVEAPSPAASSSSSKVTKQKQRPGRRFEMQWRVGQAPGMMVREAREQTNYQQILSTTCHYYRGNVESVWRDALRHNAGEFDGRTESEGFFVSLMNAAGLVTAEKPDKARQVLNNVLPLARDMLLSQHPQTFYCLIEMTMDTSPTVVGNVRQQVKSHLAGLATELLGDSHPMTILLKTPLTTTQRNRLRIEAQRMANEEQQRAFGSRSYQAMIHFWYRARCLALAGHVREALGMFAELTESMDEVYGPNSAVAIIGLVEQARIILASGSADVKVECLLGDALRRNSVLSSTDHTLTNGQQRVDAAEVRLRQHGLVFSRLAALRVLGRVHVMRWNLAAATCIFDQTVRIAEQTLKPTSPTLQLCKADLEATRLLEVEMAAGVLSCSTETNPVGRLPTSHSIAPFVPVEV
jgi:hypothetical protein